MSTGTPPSGYHPPLPEYAHPPLVAAALGVMLSSPGVKTDPATLTGFQQRLGPEWVGDWSNLKDDIHAGSQIDVSVLGGGYEIQNVLADRLIRVSNHHFGFTWRGTDDGRYPRYENLRDGFVSTWDAWCGDQDRSSRQTGSWFVSYLNRIPQGTVWQTPADWGFFRWLAAHTGPLHDSLPLQFSSSWKFGIEGLQGTMQITVQMKDQSEEIKTPCLWLRLLAIGPVKNQEASPIFDGMDAGRAAIVQTFSDLMSPAANAYWGLRRREK